MTDELTQKELNMKFKWTVEIDVHPNWIADGFDIDPDTFGEILLPYATEGEVKVKVLKAPDPKKIRQVQGYIEDPDIDDDWDLKASRGVDQHEYAEGKANPYRE